MKHFGFILAAALCCTSWVSTIQLCAADADGKAQTESKAEDSGWMTDYAKAQSLAKKENKPILLFFTGSDWCGWCKKLHADVLDKNDFKKYAEQNLILVELDFPRSKQISADLKKQNSELAGKFSVSSYPTMILTDPDGEKILNRTSGYSAKLLDELKTAVKKADMKKKTIAAPEKIDWLTDFKTAKETAKKENKKLFLFFTGSDWCGWCKKLHADVLDKPEFKAFAAKNLVLVELDFPQNKAIPEVTKKQNAELAKQFKVDGYPCTVLVDSDGKTELGRVSGYAENLVSRLDDILSGKNAPADAAAITAKLAFLPDTLIEFGGYKMTKAELVKDLLAQKLTISECSNIEPGIVEHWVKENLDRQILLQLAKKAGFKPSVELIKQILMAQINDLDPAQRKKLETELKARGKTIDSECTLSANAHKDNVYMMESAAIDLYMAQLKSKAAGKSVSQAEINRFYNANRTQFPGSLAESRDKIVSILAAAKNKNVDPLASIKPEMEALLKTAKYWKQSN